MKVFKYKKAIKEIKEKETAPCLDKSINDNKLAVANNEFIAECIEIINNNIE